MKLTRLYKLLDKHKLELELNLGEVEYQVRLVASKYEGEGEEIVDDCIPITHIQEDVVGVVERHITANKPRYEKLRNSVHYKIDNFIRHLILFADEFEETLIDDEARKRKGKLAPSRGPKGGGRI